MKNPNLKNMKKTAKKTAKKVAKKTTSKLVKKVAKKKTAMKKPVKIQAMSFGEMLDDVVKNAANQPPITAKKQKEIDKLIKELQESQGPGDAFMVFNIGTNGK